MNWLIFLFYFVIVLGVYSLLVIPFLMELSLNSPKRDAARLLRINREKWVIKNLYQTNIFAIKEDKTWPRNICQLYRGFWWGMLLSMIVIAVSTIILAIISIIGFFCGYLISPLKSTLFHDYERWGKDDERIWIAPWKILLPTSWLAIAIFWPEITANIVHGLIYSINTAGIGVIAAAGYIRYYGYAVAAITLLFILYCAKYLITKGESWTATKDFLASIKDRFCIRTTID